jgi:predicted phosphodiesterase
LSAVRVFAISDLHLDYAANREWLQQLPLHEYNKDVLILAGDVSDRLALLEEAFRTLTRRFSAVLFVPGNHDLWISREDLRDSFEKLAAVRTAAQAHGVRMDIFLREGLAIVPLQGWYDYSFGAADDYLKAAWADYRNCLWPGHDEAALTGFFTRQNPPAALPALQDARQIISFSHFLPRIDLMPERIPDKHRKIYPVLGTTVLESQLRQLGSSVHVYGHSHVNRDVTIDGVSYVNNAFGYPSEAHFTRRRLVQVY